MKIHHLKHHQAYVDNLNATLQIQSSFVASKNIVDQVHIQTAIRFNAGGHINHSLFWENLTPPSAEGQLPALGNSKLREALQNRWGSVEAFKSKFEANLLAIQGSGWGWLVQDIESGGLEIMATKDQDVVPKLKKPLLGVDMWEHAYYLQYLNNKKEYVTGIWNVVNWNVVDARLAASNIQVFGDLAGLAASSSSI